MLKLPVSQLAAALLTALAASAFAAPSGVPKASIHGIADESALVVLHGNTRPEATAANDAGKVDDAMPMAHMQLLLKRSTESEAALDQYIADLHNPKSVNYHQWLTPDQFATHYGVAQEDVAAVTSWLQAKGFTVTGVPATGLMIEFSGTAAQVHTAFHTEIHKLSVNGVSHFANMKDPEIPAALAPAIAGVVSLNNFHPHALHTLKTKGLPGYTINGTNGTYHAIAPGDLATIYNIAPAFAAGYSGKGQSIMLLQDTYLYSAADWTVFRKTFGLARPYPYGTLSQVSPTGAMTCTNPGFQGSTSDPGYGDDGEAAIDVEWATAAAPNAAIILAACTDPSTSFGGLVALVNTLNGPTASLPSVVSMSFGYSESESGAALNAAFNTAFQQAVAEGVSVFVSSGDEGAASSDANATSSTHGITVSGWASTPYNVAVGGTDFGYTASGDTTIYWNATNSNTYSSAVSYMPEIPWNDSCAGALLSAYLGTTPNALCNNTAVTSASGSLHFTLTTGSGSGGPSNCATGAPTTAGVASGTCAGYAKPAWQQVMGNPSDGVRDLPDVSLFASNGFWDAYYPVCWSNPDPNVGGFSCTGSPSTWAGFGGTSVSSPIMAGIQALVNQKTGSRWGNPNTVYYQMANAEYGTTGNSACNSTTVNKTANSCVFYDVTQGDMAVDCKKSSGKNGVAHNCYITTGTYGVLSTSTTAYQPAYSTTSGWDFATGIGTVNAYNLIMNWPTP